jgi:hypothetical protein
MTKERQQTNTTNEGNNTPIKRQGGPLQPCPIRGVPSDEDFQWNLNMKIDGLTKEFHRDCSRRHLVKMLDRAIRKGEPQSVIRVAKKLCALDAEICFDMTERQYLRSLSA